MSVYFSIGKGWRYDFTLNGTRHTKAWFKSERLAQRAEKKARRAEKRRKEELSEPIPQIKTQTDMAFLDLINLRLDHVKTRNSQLYYQEQVYKAKKWIQLWGALTCDQITDQMVEEFLIKRRSVSSQTANKELRYLRAAFNFGKKKRFISVNPTDGIEFFPVSKKIKFVPSHDEVERVIAVADQNTRDYLLVIKETLGRVSEINQLKWQDVLFDERCIVLYTRKKRGGDLTPRKVPMTERLYTVLKHRFKKRDKNLPWVFWHSYGSAKKGAIRRGPYQNRTKIMRTLCKKAGVRYFRFHALRHSGASILDSHNIPVGSIQRILGHENRKTTEIYLHKLGDSEREAIAIFDQINKKSHTKSHTKGIRLSVDGL